MNISGISGSGGSVIWDALMAVSKKTVKPTAINAGSKDISAVTSSTVSAVNKSENSKNAEFITRLENLQSTDSGLALLQALNSSVSNTSVSSIFQPFNSVPSATQDNISDNILQSIGNSDNAREITGGGSIDLLSALMSSSNASMAASSLSTDSADPLADAASVEKTLNSFMRIPDVSKYITGKQNLENMISKFDITV